jgi:hypothetical protein
VVAVAARVEAGVVEEVAVGVAVVAQEGAVVPARTLTTPSSGYLCRRRSAAVGEVVVEAVEVVGAVPVAAAAAAVGSAETPVRVAL